MPSTKYIIELTEADRKCLTDIVKKGNSPARTIMRANILLASDRGNNKHMTVAEIASAFNTTPTTVHKVRTSYVNNGLEATINRKSVKHHLFLQRLQEILKLISLLWLAEILRKGIAGGLSG